MFGWIRRTVYEAFMAGAADAARDLGLTEDGADQAEAAARLRGLLSEQSPKRLPPPSATSANGNGVHIDAGEEPEPAKAKRRAKV